MLAFDFQFCHFQPNYQFPLTISLATAFWLFYQPQNWELKQEQCTQPTKQQLSQNNTLTNELFICTVTLKECSFFPTGWKMRCNEKIGCQHLPFYWSFVLTLNRASALSGKGRKLNILLLYKSRFNTKKDRFRVKTKRGCLLLTFNFATASPITSFLSLFFWQLHSKHFSNFKIES